MPKQCAGTVRLTSHHQVRRTCHHLPGKAVCTGEARVHIPHRQSECAAHPARFPAAHPLPRPHRSIHRRAYSKQSRVRRGECCPRPRVRLECGRPRRRHRRQTQDPTVSRDQSAGVWGMHMHERRQLLSVCVLTRTGHLPYTLALPSCPHRPRFTLYGRPSRWVVGIGRPTPERQAYSGKAGPTPGVPVVACQLSRRQGQCVCRCIAARTWKSAAREAEVALGEIVFGYVTAARSAVT